MSSALLERRWECTEASVPELPPPHSYGQAAVVALLAIATGLVVFLLRAVYLNRSYNVFIDELVYLRLARSVATNLHVEAFGHPFYIHPPAFFFLEAAYLKAFGISGRLIDQLFAVRYLNVALAALSAVALYEIARRCAGWWAALAAAALFSLDPFIIEINSRNMLETSAIWWVLAGYWILFTGDLGGKHIALSTPRSVAVGVMFGLAILSKDMMAFLTFLPLAVLFVLAWALSRRTIATIVTMTCLTYAPYPVIVALVGQWDGFSRIKFHGVERVLGLVQDTGFHHSSAPSFLTTVVARLDHYGTTYALIAAGAISVCLLALRGGAANRLLAVWTGSAYALLAYGILFGTLEEQFFYYLVVPAIAATAVVSARALGKGGIEGRARIRLLALMLTLAVVFVGWSGYRWIYTHSTPGDGYEQVLNYLDRRVPPNHRHVSATDVGAQFLLERYSTPPWGLWHSLTQLQTYRPEYLLISHDQYTWDNGDSASTLLDWVAHHGQRVLDIPGNGDGTNGPVDLYHFTPSAWPARVEAHTLRRHVVHVASNRYQHRTRQ